MAESLATEMQKIASRLAELRRREEALAYYADGEVRAQLARNARELGVLERVTLDVASRVA